MKTAKNSREYSYLQQKKSIALFLSLSLILSESFAYASPSNQQPVTGNQNQFFGASGNWKLVTGISIPPNLGRFEEEYTGTSDRTVILLQDAHAIPDAQENIQKLIGYFQAEYGVHSVALEGASSRLDPQIFRSFPDKEILKKVFRGYMDQGELTGGTASAVFSPDAGNEMIYQGIEDWNLYEEGLSHYLQAIAKEPEILSRWQMANGRWQEEKKKIYSKELLKVDNTLEDFYKNQRSLLEVLQKLSQIKAPPQASELATLLTESHQSSQDPSLEIEVKRIAEQLRKSIVEPNGARRKITPGTIGSSGV